MEQNSNKTEYRSGVIAILFCEVTWGFLPIYWNLLDPLPSSIIILYRIFLVFLTALLLCAAFYRMKPKDTLRPLTEKKTRLRYFIAGLIITVNWSLYIYAITSGQIVQSSIGYYIQPIMVAMAGVLLYKEPLTRYKFAALILACVSLLIIIWHFKELPGLALAIAGTFAAYSVLKKGVKEPPMQSLACETVFLAPFSLLATIAVEAMGKGACGVIAPWQYALLALCGLMTIIPLALFNKAATRVPLVLLGLAGYISPSISLLLGIFVYREPFDAVQFGSFAIIWAGLAYYSYGEFRQHKG